MRFSSFASQPMIGRCGLTPAASGRHNFVLFLRNVHLSFNQNHEWLIASDEKEEPEETPGTLTHKRCYR